MKQIYRIYINDKVLYLSDVLPLSILDCHKIDNQSFDFLTFLKTIKKSKQKHYLLQVDKPKKMLDYIKKSCKLIKASGGLVANKEEEFLFIYRNKKWDLPKGKVEKGEKMKQAGIREVEEECGVEIHKAKKIICKTYHVYYIENEPVLKQTNWYYMKVKGSPALVPQQEEGITKAIWTPSGKVLSKIKNTYPSIIEVWETYVDQL